MMPGTGIVSLGPSTGTSTPGGKAGTVSFDWAKERSEIVNNTTTPMKMLKNGLVNMLIRTK
jgi:hypothetical protein